MEDNKMKKSVLKAQFNSLEINEDDPTILKGKVIVHDFEKSGNNQIISEKTCAENMNTLIGKRIVCKYIPSEENNGTDSLANHEETVGKDREGNEIGITETSAIGFIENVYIDDYTDEDDNAKRVLFADVVIWNDDKYANVVGLLQEWIDRGVKIHMSVEYLYCNSTTKDGIENIESPIIYVAHTLLNSEQRGDYVEILPSYDCASLISLNEKKQWNKTVNQLNKIKSQKSDNTDLNKKKEGGNMAENKFLKSLNDLSFGDLRTKIYTELSKVMVAEEYENMWISNYFIFDTYFIYETYVDSKWVNYKIPYSINDKEEVTVEYDKKQKVEFKSEWVAVTEYNKSQNSLKEKDKKIKELEASLNAKEEEVKTLNKTVKSTNTAKTSIENKFNSVTDKLTSLNSLVETMKPIVEKYNEEKYEKSLNDMKEKYEKKFNSVNAMDKFESEEVQNLIKKSVGNDNEEKSQAITSLNAMIVEAIEVNDSQEGEEDIKLSVNSVEKGQDLKDLRKDISETETVCGIKFDE